MDKTKSLYWIRAQVCNIISCQSLTKQHIHHELTTSNFTGNNRVWDQYVFKRISVSNTERSTWDIWCAILIIAHQLLDTGSCVHFSGISTCGRTSHETVSHPQCPPLPTLCKVSLPIYVIVTNKLLQPLTTTWYNSLLSFSLLKI